MDRVASTDCSLREAITIMATMSPVSARLIFVKMISSRVLCFPRPPAQVPGRERGEDRGPPPPPSTAAFIRDRCQKYRPYLKSCRLLSSVSIQRKIKGTKIRTLKLHPSDSKVSKMSTTYLKMHLILQVNHVVTITKLITIRTPENNTKMMKGRSK